ncbi:SDR family NAD(P)-dependent oxidoreductase [Candidatus Caldatribacterium sp.]|uniref:SDR family NAD(P)-dependent oxidoreductase n=1 Tax=Candidatus Caldatribacterium sp. TaxID=2282143 RepID=UPI00299AA651|nr:3-oxoacyl-ACP reductase FabG [Candidatus Caldatribacterium sp.]MDW8081772.1 3-oxoacyl-ACP reductase family protein [Candidatus Calescibacterium sp.]
MTIAQHRVVLVTGASRGIGRGIALAFASFGVRLAIHYHTREKEAQEVRELAQKHASQVLLVRGDISVREEVEQMFRQIEEHLGTVDILVNNAATAQIADPDPLSINEALWDRLYAVNMKGVFLTCALAIPKMMEKRWGRIINISSTAGLTGGTSGAHYAATKGALIPYSKALARAFAPYGITVNVVAPGKIETELFYDATPPEEIPKVVAKIPAGRLGKPEDVAQAVLYFASEEAAFVTGQVLVVSGGYGA